MNPDRMFLSPAAYADLKAKTTARLKDDPIRKPLADRPFLGLPIVEDPEIPHWIRFLTIGRVSGERVAYVVGGRLFHWTGLRGAGIVFEAATWSKEPKPADRAGTCLLSLAAIEPGDLVTSPLVIEAQRQPSATPDARILWSAIETIRDYPPPGRQIAPGSTKP